MRDLFPRMWQRNYGDGAFFKDKVIIVGASAQIMHDVVDTPLGPSTCRPRHAFARNGYRPRSRIPFRNPTGFRLRLSWPAGVAAWGLITFVRRPVLAALGLISVALVYLLATRVSYDTRGFFLLTVPVLCAFVLSGVCSLGFEYALERLEKLRTRRTLERYVSKNLVKEILENPDSYYHSCSAHAFQPRCFFQILSALPLSPRKRIRRARASAQRIPHENDGGSFSERRHAR